MSIVNHVQGHILRSSNRQAVILLSRSRCSAMMHSTAVNIVSEHALASHFIDTHQVGPEKGIRGWGRDLYSTLHLSVSTLKCMSAFKWSVRPSAQPAIPLLRVHSRLRCFASAASSPPKSSRRISLTGSGSVSSRAEPLLWSCEYYNIVQQPHCRIAITKPQYR